MHSTAPLLLSNYVPDITFNVNLLNSLHDNKPPGPDEISSRIL